MTFLPDRRQGFYLNRSVKSQIKIYRVSARCIYNYACKRWSVLGPSRDFGAVCPDWPMPTSHDFDRQGSPSRTQYRRLQSSDLLLPTNAFSWPAWCDRAAETSLAVGVHDDLRRQSMYPGGIFPYGELVELWHGSNHELHKGYP